MGQTNGWTDIYMDRQTSARHKAFCLCRLENILCSVPQWNSLEVDPRRHLHNQPSDSSTGLGRLLGYIAAVRLCHRSSFAFLIIKVCRGCSSTDGAINGISTSDRNKKTSFHGSSFVNECLYWYQPNLVTFIHLTLSLSSIFDPLVSTLLFTRCSNSLILCMSKNLSPMRVTVGCGFLTKCSMMWTGIRRRCKCYGDA